MSPLPGSDKYRVKPVEKKLTWEQSVIKRAQMEIKIEDVLSRYYDINVPYDAVSWKVRCPYALEHEDGGLDKQFRVYSESNTGYCFAMHGRIDNIRLYRETRPYLSTFDCATSLLDDYDISYRRKPYQEIFDEIREESSSSHFQYVDLVDAMKLYLGTISTYESVEYDDDVVEEINRFNSEARMVCMQAHDLEEVEQWYLQEKEKMRHFLLSKNG